MNRALTSLYGGLFKMTLTVPLMILCILFCPNKKICIIWKAKKKIKSQNFKISTISTISKFQQFQQFQKFQPFQQSQKFQQFQQFQGTLYLYVACLIHKGTH